MIGFFYIFEEQLFCDKLCLSLDFCIIDTYDYLEQYCKYEASIYKSPKIKHHVLSIGYLAMLRFCGWFHTCLFFYLKFC